MSSHAEELAEWVHGFDFARLPADLVESTKLRVLDVIGLVLAGTVTPFGRSVRQAAVAMGAGGPSRLLGTGDCVGVAAAAFANGALSQALEFDDTHNESIVHMSSPAVAAGLALAENLAASDPVSGRRLIAAIALGNEVSCRIGSVAPGQFHRRGFHPTGLFAPFGASYLAGKLLGLSPAQMTHAAGIAGSFAAGILECWVDGTQSKYLHPGWAAQSGIAAAFLGQSGATGPRTVLEGRFGVLESHLQDRDAPRDYARIADGLGEVWESRRASFKPFPAAHVLHPYIDALLRLRQRHRIDPRAVRAIRCPVAAFILPIVCEPVAEKRRPASHSHGRVSFQYTLAEALWMGRLGRNAYQEESLRNPEILGLADRVEYRVDPDFPGPERFKGAVTVVMEDGAVYEEIEEHNRGSAANPMSREEILGKFAENAATRLGAAQIDRLAVAVAALEDAQDAGVLVGLSIA